jgi:hypothetical protein
VALFSAGISLPFDGRCWWKTAAIEAHARSWPLHPRAARERARRGRGLGACTWTPPTDVPRWCLPRGHRRASGVSRWGALTTFVLTLTERIAAALAWAERSETVARDWRRGDRQAVGRWPSRSAAADRRRGEDAVGRVGSGRSAAAATPRRSDASTGPPSDAVEVPPRPRRRHRSCAPHPAAPAPNPAATSDRRAPPRLRRQHMDHREPPHAPPPLLRHRLEGLPGHRMARGPAGSSMPVSARLNSLMMLSRNRRHGRRLPVSSGGNEAISRLVWMPAAWRRRARTTVAARGRGGVHARMPGVPAWRMRAPDATTAAASTSGDEGARVMEERPSPPTSTITSVNAVTASCTVGRQPRRCPGRRTREHVLPLGSSPMTPIRATGTARRRRRSTAMLSAAPPVLQLIDSMAQASMAGRHR